GRSADREGSGGRRGSGGDAQGLSGGPPAESASGTDRGEAAAQHANTFAAEKADGRRGTAAPRTTASQAFARLTTLNPQRGAISAGRRSRSLPLRAFSRR